MRQVKVYHYCMPMEAGVILREQRLKVREGLIIHLQQDQCDGWGEIAPLPGFSQENLPEVIQETQRWLSGWCNGEHMKESHMPSVAFGISCALAELNSLLPEQADYRKVPLCTGDPDELLVSLAKMDGEKVAKVKVGLYEAVRDGIVVNMLLDAIPDLYLRLDANRSWTPTKAEAFTKYVKPEHRSRIAFLEEPCKTPEQSLKFAAESNINIAWDETVREPGFVIAKQSGVTAIIVKPTLIGSIHRCQQLIIKAQQAGLMAVISSSIESSFGLSQLARLASWLTPGIIPGLDTLSLMQGQIIRPWPACNLPLWTESELAMIWQN